MITGFAAAAARTDSRLGNSHEWLLSYQLYSGTLNRGLFAGSFYITPASYYMSLARDLALFSVSFCEYYVVLTRFPPRFLLRRYQLDVQPGRLKPQLYVGNRTKA
jgi:hypothetical protein